MAIDQTPFSLVTILNNQYADGTDVSWIWDGHFEDMVNFPIEKVITSGMKVDEMTRRLEIAGLDKEPILKVTSNQDLVQAIKESQSPNIHILATYTAMLDLRKYLIDQGYLKK